MSRNAPTPASRPRRVRPRLEPLEDRLLLSGLTGMLFNDLNGDGSRQPGEPGLAGRTVFLDTNHDGKLGPSERSAATAVDGSFSFTDTGPGTFTLCQLVPPGWKPSSTVAPDTSAAGRLIRLGQMRADPRFAGIDGSGYSVAVLDTGIEAGHPFLQGAVVYQHDYLNNDPIADDPSGHGTNVASLIASRDLAVPGVAPGAGIISLKVLDDDGGGSFGLIDQGLRWVIANAARYNIVSVNLSLGDGGNYASPTSMYGIGGDLAELARMGIVVVAAAGNGYGPNDALPGVTYPAADPNVIAVGAVWDANHDSGWSWESGAIDSSTAADRIASFSQRGGPGSQELFAPGALLVGAAPGGGTAALSGTSMAASLVAGLVPLAQQYAVQHLGRRLTTDEVRTLMHDSGAPVIDGDDENDNVPNTGLTYRRIDALSMLGTLAGEGGFTDGPLPQSRTVTVIAGQDTAGIELGTVRPGIVRGVVYRDGDGDRRLDPGETPLAGRTVYSDANGNGRLDPGEARAVTDALGRYSLGNLPMGTTTVRLVPLPGELPAPAVPVTVTSALDRGIDFAVPTPQPNHAPELLGNGRNLVVVEDGAGDAGASVGDILGATFRDADPGAKKGIAVTSAQGGRWQYSLDAGASWIDMYSPSFNGARLLREQDRVRLIPARNATAPATLGYYAWDQTIGAAGGSIGLSGRTGGTGAFSATSAIVQCVILPSNDAPVLSGPGTLPAAFIAGRVADLVAGKILDADADAVGIAIEALAGDGRWQFSRDNGKSFSDIGPLGPGQARLLEPNALIRFYPGKGAQGTFSLTYRAWDRSQGRDGVIVTLPGVLGGSSPFSPQRVTASLAVRAA